MAESQPAEEKFRRIAMSEPDGGTYIYDTEEGIEDCWSSWRPYKTEEIHDLMVGQYVLTHDLLDNWCPSSAVAEALMDTPGLFAARVWFHPDHMQSCYRDAFAEGEHDENVTANVYLCHSTGVRDYTVRGAFEVDYESRELMIRATEVNIAENHVQMTRVFPRDEWVKGYLRTWPSR